MTLRSRDHTPPPTSTSPSTFKPRANLLTRLRRLAVERRSADTMMIALAVTVGFATGLLAVALIVLVEAVQEAAFAWRPEPLAVLLAPATGGLMIGLLTHFWFPEVAGSGVSQVMAAIALRAGHVRAAVAPVKLAASAVALGTGGSGGREGPIVQIGGAVASALGRLTSLDEERLRSLIGAGAGAGIAASFNAPIGGMLFAFEVVIGGFATRHLQTVVVAAVVASVTARELIGEALIYSPPPYTLGAPWELLLYALLGLAAVAVGIAYIRVEHGVGQVAARARVWPPLRTAAGGLVVGLIALAVPEVLGTGDRLPDVLGVVREPIAAMLGGEFTIGVLVLLLVAKLVATCVSIGTGNAVGSFSPAIFIGAALGGMIGHGAAMLLPEAGVQPGAFAVVGAAAVIASAARAPLTGMLLVFELTGDYGLVLPLMLATGIATFVADRVDRASLYTLPLLRRGIVYAEPEDVDIMQTVRVGEVMTTNPDVVPADLPLDELRNAFARTRHHGFPVVEGDRLVGVVTLRDLARADDGQARTVADICTRQPLTVTPADPVFRALRRMAALDVGRLPVVAEADRSRLVGLVRRSDIVKAYQRAVTRNLGAQQRRAAQRLRDLAGTQFLDLVVDQQAPAAGRAVREIDWPQRTILTSVRRNGELILPHGDTVLQAGDEVTVLTDRTAGEQVRTLLAGDGVGTGGPGAYPRFGPET